MLKQSINLTDNAKHGQPPSGGCVLKLYIVFLEVHVKKQPPSGGCVLKQLMNGFVNASGEAAAFGRLCVETKAERMNLRDKLAAAFGRLCVETCETSKGFEKYQAAAFGRLCVETARQWLACHP